jgi:hypothetical protein
VESSSAGPARSRSGPGAFEGRRAITVVGRTLVRIAQHLVGMRDFLEHLLRLLVARIFVRVKLHGLLAIGLFHFFGSRALWHSEQFVVVVLGHVS